MYSDEVKQKIGTMTPGVTGIGSIVFRDEEKILSAGDNPREIYREKVAPYKGILELWYQKNCSFLTDIKIMILTFWVIVSPESNLHYKWLKNLPQTPTHLC
jgi:lipopolysaccharide/colanic/teichoic acid biosynthesis glycosyltransferase